MCHMRAKMPDALCSKPGRVSCQLMRWGECTYSRLTISSVHILCVCACTNGLAVGVRMGEGGSSWAPGLWQ